MAKVLVFDDHKIVADGVASALVQDSHQVTTVYDLNSALEQVRTGSFDIVITDRESPGDREAGFKVVEAVRHKGDTIPVVMMSAADAVAIPIIERRLHEIGGDNHFVDKYAGDFNKQLLAFANGMRPHQHVR